MSAFEFLPGVRDGMSIEAYHAMPALSSTGIKVLRRSPAHYLAYRATPWDPTPAMRIGTAIHTLVLEPHRAADVVLMPVFNNRSKYGREDRDAWLEANKGLQAFSEEDFQRVHAAAYAVSQHTGAQALLSNGVPERSVFWRDAAEGIECRARYDWHRADGGIVDLKSCQDASPEGASRAIAKFGYAISAAHYWAGHEHALNESPKFWAFIFVESDPPHGVACYVLDSASLLVGMEQCAAAYRAFAECLRTGRWPAYADTIEPIGLPAWAKRKF